MKVENKPDGWHLRGDNGEHYGPMELLDLEDLLDLIENRAALDAGNDSTKLNGVPGSEPDDAGPLLRYSV